MSSRNSKEAKAALVEAYGESAKPWAEVKAHLRSELLREFNESKI